MVECRSSTVTPPFIRLKVEFGVRLPLTVPSEGPHFYLALFLGFLVSIENQAGLVLQFGVLFAPLNNSGVKEGKEHTGKSRK